MSELQTVPQSGVIPFRRSETGLEIFLVTARKSSMWVIPKGHLEPDMSVVASAAKEALEEAGVEGSVYTESIGRFSYEKGGKLYAVVVFPLEVTTVHEDWDEKGQREREWVSLEEAQSRLVSPDLKKMLGELSSFIETFNF